MIYFKILEFWYLESLKKHIDERLLLRESFRNTNNNKKDGNTNENHDLVLEKSFQEIKWVWRFQKLLNFVTKTLLFVFLRIYIVFVLYIIFYCFPWNKIIDVELHNIYVNRKLEFNRQKYFELPITKQRNQKIFIDENWRFCILISYCTLQTNFLYELRKATIWIKICSIREINKTPFVLSYRNDSFSLNMNE